MGGACCKEDIDFSGEVDLTHFSLLRSVGKGAFGKVRIVEHKSTKQVFALKYINKAKCVAMKAADNMIQERRLLEEINHTFICNMKYAFQDDENLFMVLDLMLGGDLRFHLERTGAFPEKQIQFYAAEIASGLNYLHSKNIVHRDLKPDNVMLDQAGHAHLMDFNVAVKFKEGKPLKAVAGSLAYMAPEILLKKGYYASVDYWSLGVLLFECLYKKRPFKAKLSEQLSQAIKADPIEFINFFADQDPISQNCTQFLSQLLTRNVKERLASKEMGGFQGYKEHAFFTGLDWGQLEKKALIPPFVPDPKKVNFDATHELEELLLEDNPLTQQQKRKYSDAPRTLPNGDPLPQDWITLEEKFKVYDYTKPYVTDMSGATVLNPPEGQPAPDNAVSSQPPTTAGSFLGESLRRISLGTKGSKKAAATKQQRSNLALVPRAREAETESLHRDVMEGREEEVMAEGNNKDATSTKDGGESAHEKSITSLPGDGSAKRRESVSPPQERNAIPEESA